MSIKILLADDHGIICQGLRSLLEKQSDIKVVGEAEDGRQAFALVQKLVPDMVVMDVTMPNLNGVDATRQIVSRFPNTKVIALSIHSNKRFVTDMLRAGASGYILKECLFEQLIHAIRTVAGGDTYLSPKITGVVISDYVERHSRPAGPCPPTLTERELDVLRMIAEGKSMKEIALAFHLSIKTVELDRRQIMQKLNVHSIADLTKYAIREGLVSLE